MNTMDLLQLGLIVLVVAGIWALVELALTIRKARGTVEVLGRSANDTIEQVQPVIAKLDGTMDDLQPAIKQVDPLVEKIGVAVVEATQSVGKVNVILDDVSHVSGTAADVTGVVNQVANNAASSVNGVINRITGKAPADAGRIAGGTDGADAAPAADFEAPSRRQAGYITYDHDAGADAAAHEDASAQGDAESK
ncbi:hypothetical protein HMPREF2826_06360 [Olsenella sp. HMSC062G07]|nr:hypothetical protein HMPREF2826_06360 [Olsenella sp. HMSC062G07]